MTNSLEIAAAAVRMYAETHPRPTSVNQLQAAEMLGRSTATICLMVKSGKIRLNEVGRIPIGEIDRILAVRTHEITQDSPRAA